MSDLLDKAKKTREQAAAMAAEMRSHASAKASELRDTASDMAREVRESLAVAAGNLRDGAVDKVRETLADFNAALPMLRDLGYVPIDVSITLGLPPSLRATFDVSREVTDEEVDRAIEECGEKALASFLVRALSRARHLQSSIAVAGMKPRGIAVEIGLTPNVSIRFA